MISCWKQWRQCRSALVIQKLQQGVNFFAERLRSGQHDRAHQSGLSQTQKMPSNLDRELVAVENGLVKICDKSGLATASDVRGEAPKGAPHWGVKPPMQSLLACGPLGEVSSSFFRLGPGTGGSAAGDGRRSRPSSFLGPEWT